VQANFEAHYKLYAVKDDLSKKSCLVIENGGFHSFALKLAESFGAVYYYTEYKNAFPNMAEAVVGSEWQNGEMLEEFDGLPLIRVRHLFDYVKEVDCIVFLDTYNGDMADFFRDMGKPVFSGFAGCELELDRWTARELFDEQGMDLADAKRIVGLPALRKYLDKQDDKKWVKVSRYRKLTETFATKDPASTELKLDQMAYKLGPLQHISEFIVESDLPDMVEEGYDGFNVHGEFPAESLAGVEIKGCSYAGAIFKYDDLTEGVKKVNEGFAPILKKVGYQGAFSTELRTSKDGKKHYILEPTTRCPSPPNELYQELYTNLAEIVWEVANGRLPVIETKHKYGMQLVLQVNFQDDDAQHISINFPEKYRANIKLKNPIKIDGEYYALLINDISEVGAIVATADSLEECKKKIIEVFEEFNYANNATELSDLDKAIEEFEKMTKKK